MPKGFGAVYFMNLFSTVRVGFPVLYSTLILYMKDQIHLGTTQEFILLIISRSIYYLAFSGADILVTVCW